MLWLNFRYQPSIENPKESTDTKPAESKPNDESDKMTPKRLKQITLDMLNTCTPEYAEKLIQNLKNHYHNHVHVLCKMTYMIYLNMAGWRDIDKMEFLNWYHKRLRTIAKK